MYWLDDFQSCRNLTNRNVIVRSRFVAQALIQDMLAQRAQDNKFIENGLKTQAFANQMNARWILIVKERKTTKVYLGKTSSDFIQGDSFFSIALKLCYKFGSQLPLSRGLSGPLKSLSFFLSPLFYTIFISFPLSTCRFRLVVLILVPSTPP